jgi:hypothetical protein
MVLFSGALNCPEIGNKVNPHKFGRDSGSRHGLVPDMLVERRRSIGRD